jgi:putative endonuclease
MFCTIALDSRSSRCSVRNDSGDSFFYLCFMNRSYWVYIVASQRNGTIYIGVTNNLARRAYEHRTKAAESFTRRYGVSLLVWYEEHADISEAITREKSLKRWERKWKLKLIEDFNPDWRDLYLELNH